MAFRILITGASIAGNTATWWLVRAGHDVTVVERVRDGRQTVDVRGLVRAVLRRTGPEAAALALARGTGRRVGRSS